MTKFTAWLIRSGPGLISAGWLAVCIAASELEIIKAHCTTALIMKGVAVGLMIYWLSGHLAVRLLLWLEDRRRRHQLSQR